MLLEPEQDVLLFFDFINNRHPSIRLTVEKEVDHKLPFLECKKAFTGVLTNYFTFAAPSYKIGLVRTLIDTTFKINNTWVRFPIDVKNLTFTLRKNLFPSHLIDKVLSLGPRLPQLIMTKFDPLSH